MAKIQAPMKVYLPPSDWEKDVWDKDDYQRHTQDFEKILVEYRELRKNYGPIDARWRWLERKGAVRLESHGDFFEVHTRSDYTKFSNMFSRFTEWCHFNEVRDGVETEAYEKMLKESGNLAKI